MKAFSKLMMISLSLLSLSTLTSCAAGSLTAGYAARSNVAESLTADGEQKIVDRTKREIASEMRATPPCVPSSQYGTSY